MSISVADFPQVWQKPSAEELLASLKKLQVEPPIWNPKTSRKIIIETCQNAAQFRREVAAYLSSIVSSSLGWIQDDDEKEALWDEASRRLSERCGRAAMGEITRRWPLESQTSSPFELIIREPPIIGDCLGLKTWGSSYLLAQSLGEIAEKSLSHLLQLGRPNQSLEVLELGSGTGLLGMAAAAIWQTNVILTDLPSIMANLGFNIERNRSTIEILGGGVESGALTWGSDEDNAERFGEKNQFKIVLAADPLYDDDHPELLSSAIHDHLMIDNDARAVVMVPQRDLVTKRLIAKFLSIMASSDLKVLEEHTLAGQDDWDEDGEDSGIECWWAVFGRQ
ncbi:S-adenosylmethionine-dependent methyltransferase-like protein [Annulohypoxylon truncatum]|uniref:S-adenosylmethionine-dependent methyltransferase-like protein n=1 Tax=Annulohypoxylon truncatum TaxID=327061 RepID=UPI002008606D|nr:S-adenosylmethionine-dependent methyltransferase-like protein [Annulohypoxylon truncatum]KAI1209748.1 S-adenosylmethionine-dependent methyltransferase-like protein [Annulohypoxylon truncatum]